MITLSYRDRRILLVGIPVIIGIASIGKGVPRLQAWQATTIAMANETRERLRKLERDAATFTTLRDSMAERERRLALVQAALVHGRTTDGAAAAFASLLERLADRNNVFLLTVTLNPDSVVRFGVARVAVRLSGETDVAGLLDFLSGIESHTTPMIVRELTVSQPDPTAPSSRAEALRVDLSIQTLARIESATPRSSAGEGSSR